MKTSSSCGLAAALLALAYACPARAQTVAHYRFEEGAAGTSVPVTADAAAPAGSPVLDSSGNGNHLKTFADFTAPVYSASVAGPVILPSGAPNARSLDFTPNQDIYSLNADAAHGASLNDFIFSAFTIEASFNLDSLARWNGLVVKDGNAAGPLPALVLKVRDDTDRIQIEIVDGSGTARQVQSGFVPTPGAWYSVAAVNDGTTLSLYTKGPGDSGYVLQGTDIVTGGALLNQYGVWAVGRGWFNGIADWTDGRIDEVRLSGSALAPSQFLQAAPEPGAAALLVGLGLGAGLLLRKRRAR